MKTNYVFNLEILFFVFLVFTRALLGKECNSNGINCISCTSYQECDGGNPIGPVINGEKSLDSFIDLRCEGNKCDQDKLEQCHVKYNCYGLNECTQAGVFPDAEDESNYYVCLNDPTAFVKYEFRCMEGEFFDKSTLMCIPKAATLTGSDPSSSLVDATGETESTSEGSSTSSTESTSEGSSTSSTESTSEGSSTSSTESTSEGSSTSSTESTSEGSSTSSTESSSTTSTSSTEITTSTPPSTISTTPFPFVCLAPGIFPNPSNCKMYHRCSTSLNLFNYVCPGTSYFNENLLKCSMKITPACQAQILQNSSSTVTTPSTTPTTKATTTSSPTTTTSTTTISTTTTTTTTPSPTTTTTTPSPTTTTTTTATTIPSPTTPIEFSCPMSGTFSNPNSCKTYYRCSTSGKSFMYTCPGETYFNEFTKRCSLQITPRCQKLLQS